MTEWWRGSVTYQVYPRSFQDDNGDGIGDLKGIARRLDHIAALGCDCVWLSPINTSPMKDMGYDVADYMDVDPTFGTLQDFDALVTRAHDLGMKVIIDQVLNHCSDQHPYFKESRQSRLGPKADWFIWADPNPDGTPPNNWISVFGGPAWTWDARRKQYYLHNFLAEQPEWNFRNPDVVDYMESVLHFWLKRGVDGFRFDTVNYFFKDAKLRNDAADYRVKLVPDSNPYYMQYHLFSKNQPENLAWLERIRKVLDQYGATTSVGEVGESHVGIKLMGEYTQPGRLHQCYSFEMLGPDFSAAFFRQNVEDFFKGAPNGWPMWAFGNHDVPRHVTRWARHGASPEALAKQSIMLLCAMQGSICLWQGEELGQTDTQLDFEELTDVQGIAFWPEPIGRDNTRTPMVWDDSVNGGFSRGNGKPWLPVKAPQLARNVASQQGKPDSVLEFYRHTLAFRRASPDLITGGTRFFDLPEPILAFTRGDGTLCVYNLSPVPASLAVAGVSGLIGPSVAAALTAGKLELGPNGAAWMKIDGPVSLSV